MKLSRLIVTTCCTLSLALTGCNATFILPPNPQPSPMHSPSESPAPVETLALPMQLVYQRECGGGEITEFEVDAQGQFQFAKVDSEYEDAQPELFNSQLSAAELKGLQALIQEHNLYVLRQDSEYVSPNADQTEECRSVAVLKFQHGDKTEAFDLNGRTLNHTEAYAEAFKQITSYLKQLRENHIETPNPQEFEYGFPLRLTHDFECGEESTLRYQVDRQGLFTFNGIDGQQQERAPLSPEDQASLQNELDAANLAQRIMDSEPVAEDAPQTRECRTIQNLELQVNGEPQNFDLNGRTLNHTEAYREALNRVVAMLERLETKYQTPEPPEEIKYAFPLVVKVEGECDLGDWERYRIESSGTFAYAREDLPTFAPGAPPIESSELSPETLEKLLALLNDLNLYSQFQTQTPIPPDSPQTADCRSVEVLEININGETQRLMGRSTRTHQLDENYLKALAVLSQFLEELKENAIAENQ